MEKTNARLILHEKEQRYFHGKERELKGTSFLGKILNFLQKNLYNAEEKIPEIKTRKNDLILRETKQDLDIGKIEAKAIRTKGHTEGSTTLVINSKQAFVGDVAMNLPFLTPDKIPFVVEDQEKVKQSWELLLKMGIEKIYPGHGKPFPASELRDYLNWINS